MWKKYRKKPVLVDGFQITEDFIMDYVGGEKIPGVELSQISWHPADRVLGSYRLTVKTLSGPVCIQVGDWLLKGVKGELYPCKDEIFRETYDPDSH